MIQEERFLSSDLSKVNIFWDDKDDGMNKIKP
jgi:hypothetical protein